MKKIKVLVVDDSAFMRKTITDMLSSDEDIEVADTARDGEWALEKLKSIDVDVVTMDLKMPRMDGLEALRIIKSTYQKPVIMLSGMVGKEVTIKALELGAFDFVLKPSTGPGCDIESIRLELIEKVKLCCQSKGRRTAPAGGGACGGDAGRQVKSTNDIKAVCIAASTGGPMALTKLLTMFPADFNLPILVVQHMPAGFTKAFANRLDNICALHVKEGEDGEKIVKGTVYIAPGGYHMEVDKNRLISLNQAPQMHGVRPCADRLFISAAENIGGRLIGIVLTGMGRDGTQGLSRIMEHNGICIAEDESTCTIFGMPKSAIEKKTVHIVAPLHDIAGEVLNITGYLGVE